MNLPDYESWVWMELERAAESSLTKEEYFPSEDFDDLTSIDDLTYLDAMLGELRAAIDVVRKETKQRIDEGLREQNAKAFRRGEYIYRIGKVKDWHAIDVDRLAAWAGDDWRDVWSVTENTRVKKLGLRALAEKRGQDLETLMGTFIREEEGDEELIVTKLDYAPKYLQEMGEGELR